MNKTPRALTAVVLVAAVVGLLCGLPADARAAENFLSSVTISSSDTPKLIFVQDSGSGNTPQTYQFQVSENGLQIIDITTGSNVPFHIEPISGNIGIGTTDPGPDNATQQYKLHLLSTANLNTFLMAENNNTGVNAAAVLRAKSDVVGVSFQAHGSGRTIARFGQTLAGWAEFLAVTGNGQIVGTVGAKPLILGTNSVNRLHIAGNGNIGLGNNSAPDSPIHHGPTNARLSVGGAWQDSSSREYKHGIENLGAGEALAALEKLTPVKFAYNADPAERHVGFIAEDVPNLVATKDRKTLGAMDVVAVLARVVQEQQKALEEQQRRHDRAVAELTAKVEALSRSR
jgi:hypothetical protein